MTKTLSKTRKTKGFGALTLMSAFLIASALVRVGDGGGQTALAMVAEFTKAQASTETNGEADEIAAVLADLEARQARLDERQERLDAQANEMAAAREELRAQLDEIAAAEVELGNLLQLANDAAQQDLGRLSAVYENMKATDAAALFTQMPPAFAAGFMGLMQPAAAAQIMSALPSENAYAISVMLAGRHADIQVE